MALYIDLGTNVDPDWAGLLAISKDGISWDTVNIMGADVRGHIITGNTDSPLVKNALVAHISITNDRTEILHLELGDVLNKDGVPHIPTEWTNDQAGIDAAIADIADWIGAANGAGGAAMMAGGLATEATAIEIRDNLADLELKADNVNLNLDGVETLITSTNTKLDTIETTLDSIEGQGDLVPNSTTTNVPSTTGSVTLQASNVNRKELVIHNNSNSSTQVLFVKKEGATPTGATTTDYTFRVPRRGHVIITDYNGEVSGTWNNAGGFAMVTETTK